MTVEQFKSLRVGQSITDHFSSWRIIEKIDDTIICVAHGGDRKIDDTIICVAHGGYRKYAFSIHDAEKLTLIKKEWPQRIKTYAYGDYEVGRLGLTGEARKFFEKTLVRVEVELEVQEDGNYRILTVDGHEVKQ